MRACATRSKRPALFFALAAAVLSGASAQAGPTKDASIGLFLIPANTPKTCSGIDPISCGDENALLSGGLTGSYYAVLCVFGADPDSGISGLIAGIDYNSSPRAGVDISSWTLCADLEFPSDGWPNAREGNVITWIVTIPGQDPPPEDHCQKTVPGDYADGVTAVAGFFYLTAYSADLLRVVPHPRLLSGAKLQVAECPAKEFDLDPATQAGSVGFSDDGSTTGNLPCIKRPTEEVTWGKVKNTFRH